MIQLALRNWKLFYRDPGAVLFSLLGPIIIVLLYVFFLKDTVVGDLALPSGSADELVNSWMMAGIIASATVTTCLAGYGTMIRDRESGIAKDFDTAPVSRWSVIGAYLLNSMIIGTVMSTISVAIAEAYIVLSGGALLPLADLLAVFGIVEVSVFSAAGLLGLLSSFLGSQGAFSGANIAIGAAIGFLVGAYIPIGSLPEGVQRVLTFFPSAHTARALREIMMERPVAASFAGAPSDSVSDFAATMGITFDLAGHSVTILDSLAYLAATGLAGFALAVVVLGWKRRTA